MKKFILVSFILVLIAAIATPLLVSAAGNDQGYKKIVVIADNIDDIIISKRHADITTILVEKISREAFATEVDVDAMVYHENHDLGKLQLAEFKLSYNCERCMWTGDFSWKCK